jgi:TRAP transporter TAXI family solute receptor
VKKTMTTVGAGLLALALSSAASATEVQFTSGQLGGGWYVMSSGMAKMIMDEYPDLTIKVVPGGGTANPSILQQGKTDFGMGLDIFTFAAHKGRDLYEGKPHEKLMMVGQSFSDNFLHFIRAKGAPLGIEELFTKGKDVKIAVTQSGSSDEITFRYLMSYFKTSYDDLRKNRGFKINLGNYTEMASQFKDGQVDYVFMFQGIPGAAVTEMLQGRQAELLPWPKKILDDLSKQYGYSAGVFPANTYPGQVGEPTTLIMATTLMTAAHVPEDVVYKFTKAICKNESKLASVHQGLAVFKCATAFQAQPAPIHPGAARAYKELGLMK